MKNNTNSVTEQLKALQKYSINVRYFADEADGVDLEPDNEDGDVVLVDHIDNLIKDLKPDDYSLIIEQNKQLKKQIKDLLNWVKSDISQEQNPKLGKTSTPYRREKQRFLLKIQQMLRKPCKYVKRNGESCTLNNNCKFPNCE